MQKAEIQKAVMEQLGDLGEAARGLKAFRKAAQTFSSKHPRMIESYPKQWIGVHKGRGKAPQQGQRAGARIGEQSLGFLRLECALR